MSLKKSTGWLEGEWFLTSFTTLYVCFLLRFESLTRSRSGSSLLLHSSLFEFLGVEVITSLVSTRVVVITEFVKGLGLGTFGSQVQVCFVGEFFKQILHWNCFLLWFELHFVLSDPNCDWSSSCFGRLFSTWRCVFDAFWKIFDKKTSSHTIRIFGGRPDLRYWWTHQSSSTKATLQNLIHLNPRQNLTLEYPHHISTLANVVNSYSIQTSQKKFSRLNYWILRLHGNRNWTWEISKKIAKLSLSTNRNLLCCLSRNLWYIFLLSKM